MTSVPYPTKKRASSFRPIQPKVWAGDFSWPGWPSCFDPGAGDPEFPPRTSLSRVSRLTGLHGNPPRLSLSTDPNSRNGKWLISTLAMRPMPQLQLLYPYVQTRNNSAILSPVTCFGHKPKGLSAEAINQYKPSHRRAELRLTQHACGFSSRTKASFKSKTRYPIMPLRTQPNIHD